MAIWAAGAAPAGAATLSYVPDQNPQLPYPNLHYTAAPGEQNRLKAVVTWTPFSESAFEYLIVITDPGARITSAPPECQVLASRAVCTVSRITTLVAELGDHDDSGFLEGSGIMRGGPGDDRLHAQQSQGASLLLSGPEIDGGPGADTLTATPNAGATLGVDYLGGTTIGYRAHHAGVSVTLDDQRNDGAPGEGDFVGQGFAIIAGSPHDDELHGGDGGQLVIGLAGADRIFGDAGHDHLQGGSGADVLDGGAGQDAVYAHQDYHFNTQDTFLDQLLLQDGEADTGSCESIGDMATTDPIDQLSGPCTVTNAR